MINFLKMIMSEDNGNPSMMRFGTLVISFVVVGVWAYTCINTGQLVSFDYEEIGLLLGLQGIKAYQKEKEAPAETPKEVNND